MSLAEYREDMETCCRCSACKFVPLERAQGFDHVNICPSISRYNFHAYSGGGRLGLGVALLEREIGYSGKLLEVVYNCQACGACDISCKYAMDMEVLEPIIETRIQCASDGQTPEGTRKMISCLRENGKMVEQVSGPKESWFAGLGLRDYTREKAELIYHAGCRTAGDKKMWKLAQSAVSLIQKGGNEVGIAADHEICCGGRAYYLGYKEAFLKQAEESMTRIRQAGAKTLVTGCAECYQAFKVLYDKFGLKKDLEVLHTTEYFDRLLKTGKLRVRRKLELKATYHDPCHLGRLGEAHIPWKGKLIPGQIRLFTPPKEFRRGTRGVYGPPREILNGILAVSLVEMDRTREYAWCCGAGGGVRENNPQFANWTALERLKEAQAAGAEALVTACPGCENNFSEAIEGTNMPLKVYDVVELLAQAVL